MRGLLWFALCAGTLASEVVLKVAEQSWIFGFFDKNFSETKTFPVYEQCETMYVKWSRTSGSSSTPPYSFLIYTAYVKRQRLFVRAPGQLTGCHCRTYDLPFFLDAGNGPTYNFTIPFAPGTEMLMCMVRICLEVSIQRTNLYIQFDSSGSNGGCSAIINIVPNTTAFSESCTNDTLNWLRGPLDLDAVDASGSWPPWPGQVASPLLPPYNGSVDEMDTFSWAVNLALGQPFFVSIVDSDFNLWSSPIAHVGDGRTSCLEGRSTTRVSPGATAGAGIGGLVLGLVVGLLAAYLGVRRHKAQQTSEKGALNLHGDSPSSYAQPTPWIDPHLPDSAVTPNHTLNKTPHSPTKRGDSGPGPVYPFTAQRRDSSTALSSLSLSPSSSAFPGTSIGATAVAPRPLSPADTPRPSGQNLYVVHHDGGAAPVTVYHGDDTRVVELPPRYVGGVGGEDVQVARAEERRDSVGDEGGGQDGFDPRVLSQERRPTPVRKPSGLATVGERPVSLE
ncbi:uncharacterized protein SCHCODRAFT_01192793 [Schizophyllum commune H4-8]|uniref:Uncharacterized protein n=1 Tax=Schizophyllum commune (strain H4-8 / FGSC 9210) TaxID=578458 RepID=D8QG94_SCHCM|nr:uncharacterized protein SCHCODRAFT_01192793 [Schizophyllum commune H4-8]KAI5887960.1 hypothetical protein SCHCODRAFT_01192793 [Schizophyllum commune H4-8]